MSYEWWVQGGAQAKSAMDGFESIERERESLCELVQEEVSVADEEPLVEASGNGGT